MIQVDIVDIMRHCRGPYFCNALRCTWLRGNAGLRRFQPEKSGASRQGGRGSRWRRVLCLVIRSPHLHFCREVFLDRHKCKVYKGDMKNVELVAAMAGRELSVGELARRAGVSRNCISALVNCRVEPKAETVVAIHTALSQFKEVGFRAITFRRGDKLMGGKTDGRNKKAE